MSGKSRASTATNIGERARVHPVHRDVAVFVALSKGAGDAAVEGCKDAYMKAQRAVLMYIYDRGG
jgi:hypothetical protein